MSDTRLLAHKLVRLYRQAVEHRSARHVVICRVLPCVLAVAERLADHRLADLYIESQFDAMPVEFCQSKFRRPYPPLSVVFGGMCWNRYAAYIERGQRVPVKETE